jgi:hypothetical protein
MGQEIAFQFICLLKCDIGRPLLLLQGEAGMAAAHKLLHSAVSVPGASVHWYEKPGEGSLCFFSLGS